MPDIYLYDDVPVLRNKLQIKDEKTLELIEAEQSRANMMLLYERLFGGRSVWYSNDENIARDLQAAFDAIHAKRWDTFSRKEFAHELTLSFPKIWQTHPFREGNTRTVVMMMTFFVEEHGYYMDKELMAQSAGYVRDSFVMASLDQFSEYEHLEKILLDAICDEPVEYYPDLPDNDSKEQIPERYRKYQREKYTPEPHYQREE